MWLLEASQLHLAVVSTVLEYTSTLWGSHADCKDTIGEISLLMGLGEESLVFLWKFRNHQVSKEQSKRDSKVAHMLTEKADLHRSRVHEDIVQDDIL
nr:hypothetical protein Iba_chr02aCG10160 [Ipomoea batatas]